MKDAHNNTITPGDTVRLLSKPDGYLSQYTPATVGKEYLLKGFMGSCVVTTTDLPGDEGIYWRGRVEKVTAPARQP